MDSNKLEKFLKTIEDDFDVVSIGKSVLGRDLWAVYKMQDNTLPWLLVVGGMHAREHLSCDFICTLISDSRNRKLKYNICFVPLINPDGANLCINGADELDESLREKLVNINGGVDFSLYKANANGVDLNNNWDANWENKFYGKIVPSRQGFYGFKPMSEPEVIALADLTRNLKPCLVISYHLKGEEIYFDFFQDEIRFKRDKKIAEIFSKSSGYTIKYTQSKSSGGYKDWCVKKLKIPALTIELGNDKFHHPFPIEQLPLIYQKNRKFFKNVLKSVKIYQKFNKKL